MQDKIKQELFINQIRNLEKDTLNEIKSEKTEVSKLRSSADLNEVEAASEIVDDKVKLIESKFRAKNNAQMNAFINDSKNISKIRAMITDPSCEVPICAGIAELYFECIPDIFKYFPNIKEIPCNFKPFKVGQAGRIDTYASPRTLASIETSGFTDLDNQLNQEYLKECITITPDYIEGEISLSLDRELCNSQLDSLICYTIDTLDFLDRYINLASIRALVNFSIANNTVANTIPATSTLYSIFTELSSKADLTGYSANKIYLVNLEIIDRMSWEKDTNGNKTFPTLTIDCGNNACKVVCLPNGSYAIGLDSTMLPKVTNKYQILLVKAEGVLGGIGEKTTEELQRDLAVLLNQLKTKVVGIRALKFVEAPNMVGNVVFKTLIN